MVSQTQSIPTSTAHRELARRLPKAEILTDARLTMIDLDRNGNADITHDHETGRTLILNGVAWSPRTFIPVFALESDGVRNMVHSEVRDGGKSVEVNVVSAPLDHMRSLSRCIPDEAVVEVIAAIRVIQLYAPVEAPQVAGRMPLVDGEDSR